MRACKEGVGNPKKSWAGTVREQEEPCYGVRPGKAQQGHQETPWVGDQWRMENETVALEEKLEVRK